MSLFLATFPESTFARADVQGHGTLAAKRCDLHLGNLLPTSSVRSARLARYFNSLPAPRPMIYQALQHTYLQLTRKALP